LDYMAAEGKARVAAIGYDKREPGMVLRMTWEID
jgi:hypothetical protein